MLKLNGARSSSVESMVSSVQDLQMAFKFSVDPLLSSATPVFAVANIGSISGCTFQIFHENVKFLQTEKERRLVIESEDDDWLLTFLLTRSQFFSDTFYKTLHSNSSDFLFCDFSLSSVGKCLIFKYKINLTNVLELVL